MLSAVNSTRFASANSYKRNYTNQSAVNSQPSFGLLNINTSKKSMITGLLMAITEFFGTTGAEAAGKAVKKAGKTADTVVLAAKKEAEKFPALDPRKLEEAKKHIYSPDSLTSYPIGTNHQANACVDKGKINCYFEYEFGSGPNRPFKQSREFFDTDGNGTFETFEICDFEGEPLYTKTTCTKYGKSHDDNVSPFDINLGTEVKHFEPNKTNEQ